MKRALLPGVVLVAGLSCVFNFEKKPSTDAPGPAPELAGLDLRGPGERPKDAPPTDGPRAEGPRRDGPLKDGAVKDGRPPDKQGVDLPVVPDKPPPCLSQISTAGFVVKYSAAAPTCNPPGIVTGDLLTDGWSLHVPPYLNQWVEIDMLAPTTVNGIALYFYFQDRPAYYHLSLDGKTIVTEQHGHEGYPFTPAGPFQKHSSTATSWVKYVLSAVTGRTLRFTIDGFFVLGQDPTSTPQVNLTEIVLYRPCPA